MGELRQSSADYIEVNGEKYSESPDGAIAGLRPLLSQGNPNISGFARRFETRFNSTGSTGGTRLDLIIWSPAVVKGHQSALGTVDVVSRVMLPVGMYMGETIQETVLPETVAREPHLREFIAGLSTYGRVFVRQLYRSPVKQTSTPGATVTDWDPSVDASKLSDMKATLTTILPIIEELMNKDVLSISETELMVKDQFYHRVPVRSNRPEYLIWVTDTGFYGKRLYWDGHIIFDDTSASMAYSSSSLEAIVDSMIATTTIKPADLPDAGQTEVSLEKGATL
jgi:hypothetical protein